jgi:hypothetical protein
LRPFPGTSNGAYEGSVLLEGVLTPGFVAVLPDDPAAVLALSSAGRDQRDPDGRRDPGPRSRRFDRSIPLSGGVGLHQRLGQVPIP